MSVLNLANTPAIKSPVAQPVRQTGKFRIEVVNLTDELNDPLSSARSGWLQLCETDRDATIFHHPDFTKCELNHLPPSRLPALMILCRQDDRLAGVGALLPKVSKSRYVGGIGPNVSLHGYRLVGDRFLCGGSNEIQSLLLDAAMQAVQREGARYLLIEDVDQQSSLLDLVREHVRRGCSMYSPTSFQERLKILLPGTSAEYFGKFSSKTRNTFKRKEKKLGNIRLVRCSTIDDVPEFLRDAHQISLNTWQSDQFGLRVRGDDEELDRFTFLAMQGVLRSYLLYRDDTPMAFIIGNQHRGLYRYEEVGFDRQFQHLSPGQTLLIKVLEDMFADDTPAIFDFGMGDAEYKRMFANIETKAGNVWLVPRGIKGRSLVTFLNWSRALRQTAKKVIRAAGWYTRLRQKSRQASAAKTEASAESHTE